MTLIPTSIGLIATTDNDWWCPNCRKYCGTTTKKSLICGRNEEKGCEKVVEK